jgi:hypothetical protein
MVGVMLYLFPIFVRELHGLDLLGGKNHGARQQRDAIHVNGLWNGFHWCMCMYQSGCGE